MGDHPTQGTQHDTYDTYHSLVFLCYNQAQGKLKRLAPSDVSCGVQRLLSGVMYCPDVNITEHVVSRG